MKSLLLSLLALMALVSTPALAVKGPYQPAVHKRFLEVEREKIQKVVYDISVDSTSGSAVGLSAYLPANSIITKVFMVIETQFIDDGSGTVALHCEDSANILSATDISGFATDTAMIVYPYDIDRDTTTAFSTSTAASFATNSAQSIAAGCEISATYGGATPSAGKLTALIYYLTL